MTCLDFCLSVPLSSLSLTCYGALSVLQFLWSKPPFKSMLFLTSHLSTSPASSLVYKSSQWSPLTPAIQLHKNLEVIFVFPLSYSLHPVHHQVLLFLYPIYLLNLPTSLCFLTIILLQVTHHLSPGFFPIFSLPLSQSIFHITKLRFSKQN